MATTPELNNGQPCSSLENALEEDKTFVENIKKVLLSNLEVMNNGGLADDECRKAIIKNKTLLLFLVFLMNHKDVELTNIVIDVLDGLSKYPDGCDALLRTNHFSNGYQDLCRSTGQRTASYKMKMRRIYRALKRRGLGEGLDLVPMLDLSDHKIEYDEAKKHVTVTPPPVGTPFRFLNTGTKSRLVTLKIDGILDPSDKDDVKKILVVVPGVVSMYFDSVHEDRLNVRVLQSVSPIMLAKALTTNGPYSVYLVVRRPEGATVHEELVPLETSEKNWRDSYLPDETVHVVDEKAATPAGGPTRGASSWNFLSGAARFIRRPFW